MKQVIRYQCQFCKQEFKTPNRHNCKRDPKYKNCFSCKNNKGWESEEFCVGEGYYELVIYPDCKFNSEENEITASLIHQIDFDLQCEYYKQR